MRVVIVIVLIPFLLCGVAHADEGKLFGTQMGALTPYPGAFNPANTNLHCYAINENMCWDGKAWRVIYPLGPRHYAKPTTDTVACTVIMKANNDCWDGSRWYRLPPGALSGVVAGMLSPHSGAFITAPLQ
jgi:hypothetical protein